MHEKQKYSKKEEKVLKKEKFIKEKPFDSHEFKKSLGQNFLRDKNLLQAIVLDSGVTTDDVVVEVGAGAGTLTEELIKSSRAVLSFEVDRSLEETLKRLEVNKNFRLEFRDGLKTESDEIIQLLTELAGDEVKTYKVVANIPYYITTPLIFKFLKDERVSSITVMVQKEVAERIVSKTHNGEYGGISVLVNFYGTPSIERIVKKEMFYPVPKVDSALLKIVKQKYDKSIEEKLSSIVKIAFSSRRKTLVNNLSTGLNLEKEKIKEILNALSISESARAEELTVSQYISLANLLK